MSLALPEILYEDNHCLAVAKPAGCLSTHYAGKEETVDRAVKIYLKEKYKKPGNVFLGIVHRLDRVVSGVLLFARTSKAAARLAEQFRQGTVEKVYWAVVEGRMGKSSGELRDWLKKNESTGQVMVVDPEVAGAREASLQYQQQAYADDLSWLEIRPRTGRTHQLRVQLAHQGHPIFGDRKYGSSQPFEHIALHARGLTFIHPVRGEPISLTAPLPTGWQRRFASLFQENPKWPRER
ncbi:MAG TPA: RluA family pseudouridine synthase [Gemmataceae bacterium]|jgi:23S rRNA pseudouridine1911/1915/1917 synthase|nr:RluA family pseudouridine synthase [Gemmataceae bacterium]